MFRLFKNKKPDTVKYNNLLIQIAKLLPDMFSFIYKEIESGIVRSYSETNDPVPNYNKIVQDVKVLNDFENKSGRYFVIKGMFAFDQTSQKNVEIQIYCGYGIVLGFSASDIKRIEPDISTIKVEGFHIEYFDSDDADKVKGLVSESVWRLLSQDDIYEIEINGVTYFHLRELEDGDFIGIDTLGQGVIVTHDPFEITPSDLPIQELLEKTAG